MAEQLTFEFYANTASLEKGGETVARVMGQVGKSAEEGMAKVDNAVGKTKKQFQEVAGDFVALGIGKQITGALSGLLGAIDTVQQGMGKVRTVVSETVLPSEQLKALIHSVATETGQDFLSISTLMRDLIAQGYDPATVANEQYLLSLTKFQRIAEINDRQMSGLVKGLENMHVGGTQTAQTLDQIAAIADASSLNMGDFASIMTDAGAIADISGQSFRDIATVGALVSSAFKTGSVEATSFRQSLTKLLDPKTVGKVGAALGVQVQDAQHNVRALPQLLLEFEQATRSRGAGSLTSIFGTKQGAVFFAQGLSKLRSGMSIAGEEGLKGQAIFDKFNDIISQSSGAVGTKFSAATANLTDSLKQLQAAALAVADTLLGPLAAGLVDVVHFFKGILGKDGLGGFLAAHPILKQFISDWSIVAFIVAGAAGGLLVLGGFIGLANYAFVNLRNTLISLAEWHQNAAVAATEQAAALEGVAAAGKTAGGAGTAAATGGAAAAGGGLLGTASLYLGAAALGAIMGKMIAQYLAPIWYKAQNDAQEVRFAQLGQQLAAMERQNDSYARSLHESSEQYTKAVEKFGAIIDKFEGGALKEFPKISGQTLSAVQTVLGNMGKTALGALQPDAVQMRIATVQQGLASIRSRTNTPEQTQDLVDNLQQVVGYAREAEKEHVPGSKAAADLLTEQLKQLHMMFSPEMTKWMSGYNSDRTPRVSAVGGDAMPDWLLPGALGRANTSGAQAATNARLGQLGAAKGGHVNLDAMSIKNANFEGSFYINVDGTPIRAAIRSGAQRESAENLGGGR